MRIQVLVISIEELEHLSVQAHGRSNGDLLRESVFTKIAGSVTLFKSPACTLFGEAAALFADGIAHDRYAS